MVGFLQDMSHYFNSFDIFKKPLVLGWGGVLLLICCYHKSARCGWRSHLPLWNSRFGHWPFWGKQQNNIWDLTVAQVLSQPQRQSVINVTQINIVRQPPLGHFYSSTLTRRRFVRVAVFVILASQKSDQTLLLHSQRKRNLKKDSCMKQQFQNTFGKMPCK